MTDRLGLNPSADGLPYRDVLDGDPDRGVVLLDAELRVVYANLAARALLQDGEGSRLGALRDAVTAFRARFEPGGGARPPVEVVLQDPANHPHRATVAVLARPAGRWFVVRIAPPGQFADLSIPRLQARFQLTVREAEVAIDVAQGFSNAEIARHLGITEKTVKNSLMSVFAKCDVRNRVELALRAHDAPMGARPERTVAP